MKGNSRLLCLNRRFKPLDAYIYKSLTRSRETVVHNGAEQLPTALMLKT